MSSRSIVSLTVLVLTAAAVAASRPARAAGCDPSLVDDSAIHIATAADAGNVRTHLIQYIWGPSRQTLPNVSPTSITTNITASGLSANPTLRTEFTNLMAQLSNVGHVDMIQYRMTDASGAVAHTALGWYIVPNQGAKNRLVIVHQGHDTTLVDPNVGADGPLGIARTMSNLLREGYAVIGMYMPGKRPDDPTGSNHGALMSTAVAAGSPIQFFMEPVVAFLNYAKSFNVYSDFNMVGLSGGGWTTTVYAALDTSILLSFPIAGSIPLYLRCPGYNHDAEQIDNGHAAPTLYSIAGYQDLYILGGQGSGAAGRQRHQTQVLNRLDTCCFGQNQHQAPGAWDDDVSAYEIAIRNRLFQLGAGMFRAEIDENTTSANPTSRHMISTGAIFRTILGELNAARRVIGVHKLPTSPTGNGNDAFYRGGNGHLWHRSLSPSSETDTGVTIEGVPDSAKPGTGSNAFNVIARNIHGQPILVKSPNGSGWTTTVLPGVMNNDPMILTGVAGGDLWTFGLGTDYLPYVWDANGNITQISSTPALGPLSASLRSAGQGFHVFFLAWDRTVRHAWRATTTAAWQSESLGGTTFGYPSGTVDGNGDLVVFQLGTDGRLYWNRKTAGDQTPTNPWTGFQSISQAAGATGTVLTGMPAFSGGAGAWLVLVPAQTSNHMIEFSRSTSGTWTFTDLGGTWTSPAVPNGTSFFIRDRPYALWNWTTTSGLAQIGGYFD